MSEDIYHLGVKAIIRNAEGKILLLKTNPKDLSGYSGDGYWDIPGGRVHKGSSVEETLRREVEEETGIRDIKSVKQFSMVLANIRIPIGEDSVGLNLLSYLCEAEDNSKIKISSEHTQAGWFDPNDAAEMLKFKYPYEIDWDVLG